MTSAGFHGERLARAKALFASALELDASERAAFLERESGDDPELRDYVLQLLRSYDSGDDSFLTPPRSEDATIHASYSGPKPGTQIGSYEIREKLGQGGMGSVYEGWDSLLQRPVAIKFVAEQFAHSAQARQRFLREARAASKLSHNGIATVYGAGEHDDQLYIAFRLVDGSTVADHSQERSFDLPDALRLIREAAEALGHAHDAGVLHRDVTSRNLMIDRDGSAVIVDFGLALPEMDSRITQPGSTFGTLAYMAPEVVQGKQHDRRSDLYGLGVVLYEMLTGELPFQTERSESLLYAIVNEPLQPASSKRPELPQDVDRVLAKLLARDPVQRYQSSAELVEDLQLLEQGLRPKAKLPRRKRWPWLAATVAVVAVVIAGWVYFQRGTADTPTKAAQIEPIRMAVLPLQNDSAEPQESDYLADGLSQDLAGQLGRISSLQVTPWITSQNYVPNQPLPLQDIAAELGVDQLVVGTFRIQGERIQIRLSYVDGSTGMMDWTQDHVGVEEELLELPARFATSIVNRLGVPIEDGQLAEQPTENVQAYKLYMKGAHALRQETEASVASAQAFFESALALDPNLANAHVGLGAVHGMRYWFRWPDSPNGLGLAEQSYRRALDLNPTLVNARRGLIRVALHLGRSEECLRIATEIPSSPSDGAEMLLLRGEAAALSGLSDVAIPLLDRAIALDPGLQTAWWFRSFVALDRRETNTEAIRIAEEALRRFGEDPSFYEWIGVACQNLGRVEEARLAYSRCVELGAEDAKANVLFDFGLLESAAGNPEKAREHWESLRAILERRARTNLRDTEASLAAVELVLGDPRRYEQIRARDDIQMVNTMFQLVFACRYLGRNREALELLERMLDAGNYRKDTNFFRPDLVGIEREPGFESYLARRQKILDGLAARYFPEFSGASQ